MNMTYTDFIQELEELVDQQTEHGFEVSLEKTAFDAIEDYRDVQGARRLVINAADTLRSALINQRRVAALLNRKDELLLSTDT